MPSPDYMLTHTEVTWKMRSILIDWLVEIHTKFRLLPETIFLATNIIDRLLSLQEVSLVKFQLVGITALFIAAKYEEVMCPSVTNFLFMTDGGYEDDEILRAERHVLAQLDFNLSYPNPINFLRYVLSSSRLSLSRDPSLISSHSSQTHLESRWLRHSEPHDGQVPHGDQHRRSPLPSVPSESDCCRRELAR